MHSVCGHDKMKTWRAIKLHISTRLFGVSFISVVHATNMNATIKLVNVESNFSALAADLGDTGDDLGHGIGDSGSFRLKPLWHISKMSFPHKFELPSSALESDPGGS